MTPFARMEEWYRTHPSVWPLSKYIDMHLQQGVVISTSEVFVMGRAVRKDVEHWKINESMVTFANPDCWYVFAFAGDLSRGLRLLPYELPWLCFNRHGRKDLKFAEVARIRSLCHGKHLAE